MNLHGGDPRVYRANLWRILERLEYAAFLLSISFGLMDYHPNYGDVKKLADSNDPSELVKLLTGCLEALERSDPKRCYGGVKTLVRIFGSMVARRGGEAHPPGSTP
ncbi:MAG: hypothetical protein ACP5QI_02155 [Candidatus Bathyarchaeia archaeon]